MSLSHLLFAPYDPADEDAVLDLFTDYPYKDYQLRSMGVCKDRMAAYLKNTLTSPGRYTICLKDEGRTTGLIGLQQLPWMSEHFGVKMYAVPHLLARPSNSLSQARLLRYVVEELPNVDFLDCRVAVDDVQAAHALEICGFRYVGAEIYMGRELRLLDPPEPHPEFHIRPCEPEDRKQVLDIVKETHVHNRFDYDPMIPASVSRSLYQRLVANCFDQEQFSVLVARSGATVQGFIVSKINTAFSRVVGKTCGSLDFIGVRPDNRSRGLGAALNRHALYHMAYRGALYAAVRTLAGNYHALGTCYRTGFRVTASSLHFHRWVRRPARSIELTEPGRRDAGHSPIAAYA